MYKELSAETNPSRINACFCQHSNVYITVLNVASVHTFESNFLEKINITVSDLVYTSTDKQKNLAINYLTKIML
jgi:hypothetical protein